MYTHTHTHPFNGSLSGTTWVGRYQKGKTNLDFTEARDSEWQWHQLGHMQVCISLQADNHARTPPLSFLEAECHSCRPTNSVKALKAKYTQSKNKKKWHSCTWWWPVSRDSTMLWRPVNRSEQLLMHQLRNLVELIDWLPAPSWNHTAKQT